MEIDLHLHVKQGVALNTTANEVLYGGAAGGGKSYLMRIAAIIWCSMIPGLQVYLFRRLYDDLIKNHMEGPKGFRAILQPWEKAKLVSIIDDEVRFWNGSKIYLCHCQHEKDRFKYQGAEIHVLLIDELTHFTEIIYRFLRNRVRMVGINLPDAYKGLFPRILCGANPGNLGHLWVKSTFVDYTEPMAMIQTPEEEGGMIRQYIPARLEDNPSMMIEDPGYEQRLKGLGSEALVNAMRWGDWNIIEGAFFGEFETRKHVVKPFEIPSHWTRYRAMDWGSFRPFCVLWIAVSDGTVSGYPRGALVVYREWYGWNGKPNEGCKMIADDVSVGILAREDSDEKITFSIADPSIFKRDGGPSIGERMANSGTVWIPGDNTRVIGWNEVRRRLQGEDSHPSLFIFSTCTHIIRTLPALQHDTHKPEDVDSDGEDHAPDTLRYGVMARYGVKTKPVEKPVGILAKDVFKVRPKSDRI